MLIEVAFWYLLLRQHLAPYETVCGDYRYGSDASAAKVEASAAKRAKLTLNEAAGFAVR